MSTLSPQVECPAWAAILGATGIALAVGLTGWGAAYGTAKSATGIAAMGVMRPELIIRSLLPVIMAGIIALYGLVVGLMMNGVLKPEYSLYAGALQLGAGLTVGLSGLAAGYAVGVVGDAGVRGIAQQPRLFIGTVLILIFAEVLGLYGMILSLFINSSASVKTTCIRPDAA